MIDLLLFCVFVLSFGVRRDKHNQTHPSSGLQSGRSAPIRSKDKYVSCTAAQSSAVLSLKAWNVPPASSQTYRNHNIMIIVVAAYYHLQQRDFSFIQISINMNHFIIPVSSAHRTSSVSTSADYLGDKCSSFPLVVMYKYRSTHWSKWRSL